MGHLVRHRDGEAEDAQLEWRDEHDTGVLVWVLVAYVIDDTDNFADNRYDRYDGYNFADNRYYFAGIDNLDYRTAESNDDHDALGRRNCLPSSGSFFDEPRANWVVGEVCSTSAR